MNHLRRLKTALVGFLLDGAGGHQTEILVDHSPHVRSGGCATAHRRVDDRRELCFLSIWC